MTDFIKISNLKESLSKFTSDFGIVIGNFDGLHLGHLNHLKKFIEECNRRSLIPVLITFFPHPKIFFDKNKTDFLINSNDEKKQAINQLGINNLLTIAFDDELRKIESKEFLESYILSAEKLKLIHLGYDFKLGRGKEDSKKHLNDLSKKRRIEVIETEVFKLNDEIVSSTKIRSFIKNDIAKANELLGRRYKLSGKVIKGRGLGKKSLFPTCNLAYDEALIIPKLGVYQTKIKLKSRVYDSITNIGLNPTVSNDKNIKIETHVFFLEKDFYQETVEIEFLNKIRDEQKFDSIIDLREQIKIDIDQVSQMHRNDSNIKLALIGKDIAHSRSQVVYEELLQKFVNYTLVDCKSEEEIPTLDYLREKFQGVSITAPYKKFFLENVVTTTIGLPGINAIKFTKGFEGYNTDLLACREILRNLINEYNFSKIIILGNGTMYSIIKIILNELKVDFVNLNRSEKNLSEINSYFPLDEKKLLMINACGRNYSTNVIRDPSLIFWDLNYNHRNHIQYFESGPSHYIDGLDLLKKQAKYALKLWEIL